MSFVRSSSRRCESPGRACLEFYLRDGTLIACDTVNRPQEFFIAKRLVAACRSFDVTALANESIPLKTLADSVQLVS